MYSENLKTFITLCKYKNFTRTAEALYVAQSTITNRIAELEREVNAQLFIRDKKSVQLTESGIKFLDYAKRIVDLEEKAISDISSDTRFEKSLTIGSTNTIFDCHINEKVKSFLQRKNDTAVKIVISHSLPLIDMVIDGSIDIAFTFSEYHKNNIMCKTFCEDKMVLVTDCKNTKYKYGILLSELSDIDYYYCNFPFQNIGEYIKDLFPKYHHFPIEFDRAGNIIDYLIGSNGYSILPEKLVSKHIENEALHIVPLLDFEIPDVKSFMIYYSKNEDKLTEIIK